MFIPLVTLSFKFLWIWGLRYLEDIPICLGARTATYGSLSSSTITQRHVRYVIILFSSVLPHATISSEFSYLYVKTNGACLTQRLKTCLTASWSRRPEWPRVLQRRGSKAPRRLVNWLAVVGAAEHAVAIGQRSCSGVGSTAEPFREVVGKAEPRYCDCSTTLQWWG